MARLSNPFDLVQSTSFVAKARFDPATLMMMGMSAGTAATVGTVATIAAPVLGVMSAVSEVKAAKEQTAEFGRQATEERIAANINAEKFRRDARQEQSRARTAMAEGGVLSGTSFAVLDQNAVAQELDALTIEYQGEQRATGAEFQAAQARKEASPLKVFSAAVEGFSEMDPLNIGGQT
jgi:hypothetical protein